jgi:glycosyltransferase involved in cell wall biosynthesis
MRDKGTEIENSEAVPVTVIIPTFNEARVIGRCLGSVSGWADEIFVVDSYSTDETLEIAEQHGAQVITHVYEGGPDQWRWILANVPFRNEWLLALDADYVVTPELRDAIAQELPSSSVDGYYVRHRQMFRGRALRHGGMYPRHRLCLVRHSIVSVDENERADPHFSVTRSGRLKSDVIEDNPKDSDLSAWVEKQIKFARWAAQEEVHRIRLGSEGFSNLGLFRGRNERVLWAKRLWARLPLYWRSVGYFLYRYIIRLGFLDGKEGYLYHLTQALVLRTLLDAHVDDLRDEGTQ